MKEIEQIIDSYQLAKKKAEKVALGTVVRVEESSYRRIGARILVNENGTWVGGISGGCLEGDALKQSKKAMNQNLCSLVTYDTRDGDQYQIGVGLGCEGKIDVLFAPIDYNDLNNPIERLQKIKNKRKPSHLFKVIGTSIDKSLLGLTFAPTQIQDVSKYLNVAENQLAAITQNLDERNTSKIYKLEQTDQGELEILGEVIHPKIKIVLYGDNYDVTAMVEQCALLGWQIVVVGKAHKIAKRIYAQCNQVVPFIELDRVRVDEYTAIILMSHDFDKDIAALQILHKLTNPYLGILGPKKRFIKIKEKFEDSELVLNFLNSNNVHTPVGLDIGALTPEEIAISISSEIISTFRNRNGGQLKHRSGPIHEREN